MVADIINLFLINVIVLFVKNIMIKFIQSIFIVKVFILAHNTYIHTYIRMYVYIYIIHNKNKNQFTLGLSTGRADRVWGQTVT